jgi:hypothetical protein
MREKSATHGNELKGAGTGTMHAIKTQAKQDAKTAGKKSCSI